MPGCALTAGTVEGSFALVLSNDFSAGVPCEVIAASTWTTSAQSVCRTRAPVVFCSCRKLIFSALAARYTLTSLPICRRGRDILGHHTFALSGTADQLRIPHPASPSTDDQAVSVTLRTSLACGAEASDD